MIPKPYRRVATREGENPMKHSKKPRNARAKEAKGLLSLSPADICKKDDLTLDLTIGPLDLDIGPLDLALDLDLGDDESDLETLAAAADAAIRNATPATIRAAKRILQRWEWQR
jgi:hypothetical protein